MADECAFVELSISSAVCMFGTWRCNAVFKKTGQTSSKCGQAAQNQDGMRPVGAVETI